MPDNTVYRHIKVDGSLETRLYRYPGQPMGKFEVAERNRNVHGNKLKDQLNQIRDDFELQLAEPLPQNIVRDDALYVEFYSPVNLPMKFESFNQETAEPLFKILTIKEEKIIIDGIEGIRYRIVVMMRLGGISIFINKVDQYLNETTAKGNPKNRPLINNIEEIRIASLQSFWSEAPEIPFPAIDEVCWWEVWFLRYNVGNNNLGKVINNLIEIDAIIGAQEITFPEHTIRLVRASARQLSSSLMLLDNLAELRSPKTLNDFITGPGINIAAKNEWLQDLLNRIDINFQNNSTIVTLLDSGVNNLHPLIFPLLPNNRMFTYNAAWGTGDSSPQGGHGTPMAGLALYGDLTDALASPNRITVNHGLESYKIFHPAVANDPKLYGFITKEGVNRPVVDFPDNPRVYCMAVTSWNTMSKGRPSSWSAAVDMIACGIEDNPQTPQLFIVSSGNLDYIGSNYGSHEYPDKNHLESIQDPAQAYNALTIGAYTRMTQIDLNQWQNATPMVADGNMSPCNTTSLTWEAQWPIKPDLVMEGGNLAVQNNQIRDDILTLSPLSTDRDHANVLFYPFGETSGATALAAKFAAELRTYYPAYWPETIRALMVHSANWTTAMVENIDFNNATLAQKRLLLRCYGYGVPLFAKAKYSANNLLTLIIEKQIQPFILDGNTTKDNEYHLYTLPWPSEILQDELANNDIKLIVTLSYFIEPNPGERQYANNFQYCSHSLDFKVIKPTETLPVFMRRVSSKGSDEQLEGGQEPWFLKESARSKGSIKKDFIISSGADLATRNYIAVYPKSGWYKTRKKLGKVNSIVRYSLIVSLETDRNDVNIYNPVAQLVGIPIEI